MAIYPSKSSNPLPRPPAGRACPDGVLGVDTTAPGLDAALVPQIPASVLALAMDAKSGPLLDAVALLCTPAVALAEDQSEPNASPPVEVTGLGVGFPSEAAEDGVRDGICVPNGACEGKLPGVDVVGGLLIVD